jgi:hypothetical protein
VTAARDDDRRAEVVPLHKHTLPPVDAELVDDDTVEAHNLDEEVPTTRARQMVVQAARPLPSRRRVVASTRWWSRQLQRLVPWLPVLALREVLPIVRGLGRVCVRWAAWVHCAELAEAVREAKENERSKAAERLVKRRSGRAWGSLTVAGVGAAGMWWLYATAPVAFAAVCLLLVVVLDLVGRAGRAVRDNPLPVAAPTVLDEGVPLRQITASILGTFDREGFEEGTVQVAAPLTWDEVRKEYRIRVKTADHIRPEHVRAVERAVGARDFAIRNLATSTASVRELVIRVGDPLAHVDQPPYIETGSVSVTDLLDLGYSSGDQPFALRFAGAHVAIIGMTGAGKTKGLIWTIIDRLSACPDAVLWGIDLAAGPALPMWRGVIERKAFTPGDAEELLAAAITEIDRRMKVLTGLAEDDDPDNDADEWHVGLGPALIVVIDEFALLAEHDGSRGKADLLGKVEQIERTGRKVWVTVVMGTQKSGNSDFGSTTTSTQVAIKILLACDEADTVRLLSTAHRDAGWAPHHLAPAIEGDVRDAGKCYVESPMHRTPDIYRTYAPMPPAEVKRRARQRVADGLPSLDGKRPAAVDAVEVPPILAAVERAFATAGNPERLATTDLLECLTEAGHRFDAAALAEQLRPAGLRPRDERWRPAPKANPVRGYYLADVRAALQDL